MATYAIFEGNALRDNVFSSGEDRAKLERELSDAPHGPYTLVKILTDLSNGPPKRVASSVVTTVKTYNPRAKPLYPKSKDPKDPKKK